MTIDNNCVRAPLRYVVDDGVPPVMYVDWPEEEHKAHQPVYEEKIVTINNGRPESSIFKLSRHGFEFLNHTSNVKNFYDANDVEKNCYHEVEKLVKEKKKKNSKPFEKQLDILQLEKELLDVTGLKIVINFNEKKQSGNLNIKCKSLTEFNYIISKIKS